MRWLIKHFGKEFAAFLWCGAINTIVFYLLYLLLLQFIHYMVAYSVTFLLGVISSYCLNTYFVFKVRFSWHKLLQYPVVYVIQYLLGLFLVYILVIHLDVD